MKSQLNEVQKLQKIAGILKEDIYQEESPSADVKLGDVFLYYNKDGWNENPSYYILALSKNPRKPNTVGLWTINPKTMVDSNSWSLRKMWNQYQVADPKNLTQDEWKSITGEEFHDKFKKLSDSEKQEIVNK